MKRFRWLRGALVAVAAVGSMASPFPAQAAAANPAAGVPAVFVQTNDPAGNSIVAYRRNHDGTLSFAANYATGGNGSRSTGSASDPLASQGSLVYDRAESLLFAVNAGSNTVSVFGVRGATLDLHQVIASGGSFPASIAVHGGSLYVLNAGGAANVAGYRIVEGHLRPIQGATRSLGLAESTPPFFLASPAQAGFSPDGRKLIVTTKTNNTVDVFAVKPDHRLSAAPVRNPDPAVPFAFLFHPSGQLDLVNAGTSALAPYVVNDDGTITSKGAPVADGQVAACWIALARQFAYVANTGSGDISEYRLGDDGRVTLVNATAASGINGPIDVTTAGSGRFLYVQSGPSSSVNAYAINTDGSLNLVQTVAVPDGNDQEGIAST
jgi:6-phosphogluconolactonase (cycloisomerase 2 family)